MDKVINWGILGTGIIANSFAKGISYLEDARLYAVASRSIKKAADFAENHNAVKFYGSYEELVQDKEVDIVYIATPNTVHRDNIILS